MTPSGNLQKAWDLSRPNLGSAEYIKTSRLVPYKDTGLSVCERCEEPNCIIAHLYVLEGGKVEDMRAWNNSSIYSLLHDEIPFLHKYTREFLTNLQNAFDEENVGLVEKLIYLDSI